MLRRARFFQASSEKGVEEAQIPFDIAADFLAAVKRPLPVGADGGVCADVGDH